MRIKMLITDIDGTLTDGRIFISPRGEEFKAFDVKDGYAISHMLAKANIIPVIITGRQSEITQKRAEELHITEIHQGVSNKAEMLKSIIEKYDITLSETAYIGDDINDNEAMSLCGISACPCDAVDEIIENADYICQKRGGRGAVREFIEYLIKQNAEIN